MSASATPASICWRTCFGGGGCVVGGLCWWRVAHLARCVVGGRVGGGLCCWRVVSLAGCVVGNQVVGVVMWFVTMLAAVVCWGQEDGGSWAGGGRGARAAHSGRRHPGASVTRG
ncbi:MAG: hypothetical protein J3K34DRAFT_424545 [Monoraphidium minutum]|nr:MAG: hypothetical protein J3K34DRAFT_424545 [Monoraphidium minutum]